MRARLTLVDNIEGYVDHAADFFSGDYREAIDCLPRRQRQVIVLIYATGMTETEAAARLRVSPQTVAEHHKSAISTLKKVFSIWTL